MTAWAAWYFAKIFAAVAFVLAPAPTATSVPPKAPSAIVAPTSTPAPRATAPAAPAARSPIVPSLPAGLTYLNSPTGCDRVGHCDYSPARIATEGILGVYYADSRTVVVIRDPDGLTAYHEACHAHQHAVTEREGFDLTNPSSFAYQWLSTTEGRAWGADIESFAEACALAWVNPNALPAATYDLLRRIEVVE